MKKKIKNEKLFQASLLEVLFIYFIFVNKDNNK